MCKCYFALIMSDSKEIPQVVSSENEGSESKLQNLQNETASESKLSVNEKNTYMDISSNNQSKQNGLATSTSLKNTNSETDSIGSASSIMLDNKAVPNGSKYSNASISKNAFDADDEILVGDEKEFHDACRCGDLETVQKIIKSGIDIDCRNIHERTPLHWCAGNGCLELLKTLLDEGASVDATDKFGMDALLWAAWFGHKQCVQHMLLAGAKSTARNKHGYTWLHCAAQNDHVSIIEILNEEMQEFNKDEVDDNGRSCLHIACRYGRVNLASRLLDLNCNSNLKDKQGNTPMHIAAKHGFPELVSYLVEAKSELSDTNNNHLTALHVAAAEGNASFCEELLKYDVDVNVETEDEICPLHLAVMGDHLETVEVLLDHNADIDASNKHNQTPLHLSVSRSNVEICKLLVERSASTNVPDARSETPLHLACENGHCRITELLLLTNSNHNIRDFKGKTPLDVAARGSYVTIVDMIIKAERFRQYLATNDSENVKTAIKNITLKPNVDPTSQMFRHLLYQLATKYLKPMDWKKLAFFWGFTDRQLSAIEEQYTGKKSYKEHGHRMLLIWYHGCSLTKDNPVRSLYEGLIGIQKQDLAEVIRNKANQRVDTKSCSIC